MAGGGGGIGKAIGSTVGSVGNAIGGVGNAVGSAVGSLGGPGQVIGPAIQLASGANPLGVFGASLGSQVIGDALSSGGGGSTGSASPSATPGQPEMQTVYAKPDYNYGANTYTISKKPVDASPYFVTGEKGVYNLMPQLAPLYGNKAMDRLPGTSSYNVYQKINEQMANDAKAQEALAATYGPKTFTPTFDINAFRPKPVAPANPFGQSNSRFGVANTGFGGWGVPAPLSAQQRMENMIRAQISKEANLPKYVVDDINRAIKEQRGAKLDPFRFDKKRRDFRTQKEFNDARQAAEDAYYQQAFESRYKPIQYVNWGFGKGATSKKQPWEALANYAGKKNNPFFVPFEQTTPVAAPAAPMEEVAPTGMRSGGLAALARRER